MYTRHINSKNKERVVDREGYVRRVAALCTDQCAKPEVDNDNAERKICSVQYLNFQLLLITSKSSHDKWIIPGGGIDLNETPEEAVLREAYEEAGVICDDAEHLGVVEVII